MADLNAVSWLKFWHEFPMMHRLVLFFLQALLVYGTICAVAWYWQRELIFHPTTGVVSPSSYGLENVSSVQMNVGEDTSVDVWYSKARPGRPTIAFFHGNAGHLGHRAALFKTFQNVDAGFFALSYRGFGGSDGQPSFSAIRHDGAALIEMMTREYQIPAKDIVLYGESLGTGVATELASKPGFAGLVLQSPYTSIAAAAKLQFGWLPVDYLLSEDFSNIDAIKRVQTGSLILHGVEDTLFPVEMAAALVDAAPQPTTGIYLENTGHNDLDVRDIGKHLADFLASRGFAVAN